MGLTEELTLVGVVSVPPASVELAAGIHRRLAYEQRRGRLAVAAHDAIDAYGVDFMHAAGLGRGRHGCKQLKSKLTRG